MSTLSVEAKAQLYQEGHLLIKGAMEPDALGRVIAAAQRLHERYPNGFDHANGFGSDTMIPRSAYPTPSDRAPTVIYHNAGFLEPDLLLPLHDELIYNTIAGVVGRDFYLSNVWLQVVPPGTGRMGYHKDEHGSISITMPLQDIQWDMGSTCVVPASHLNTPPPNFCMPDISKEHGRERQLVGTLGDVVIFTPETWHGRAPNSSQVPTCRLFFNFYSRASRQSTRWSNCIPPEVVASVAQLFPGSARHMFRIDSTPKPKEARNGFKQWVKADGSSSASPTFACLLREYFYWRFALNEPLADDVRNLDLPPFRTTITTSNKFTASDYLRHLHPARTVKNLVRSAVDTTRSIFSKATPGAASNGD